jgi:hypothetical protein
VAMIKFDRSYCIHVSLSYTNEATANSVTVCFRYLFFGFFWFAPRGLAVPLFRTL